MFVGITSSKMGDRVMVFIATFNNISVISFYWWKKPGENHRLVASH